MFLLGFAQFLSSEYIHRHYGDNTQLLGSWTRLVFRIVLDGTGAT